MYNCRCELIMDEKFNAVHAKYFRCRILFVSTGMMEELGDGSVLMML